MADKQTSASGKPKASKRIGKFFRDTWGEFKKIVWPSKRTVLNNTIVVLVMVIIFAIVIWGLDILFVFLRNLLINAF